MKKATIKNKTAFKVGDHIWLVWSAREEEHVITAITAYKNVIDITCKEVDTARGYWHVFAKNELDNDDLLSPDGCWCRDKIEADDYFRELRQRKEDECVAEAVRTLAKLFK